MESFFTRLKVESIHAESFKGLGDTYPCMFEYIELFYNTVMSHSSNDCHSPREYERLYDENCA